MAAKHFFLVVSVALVTACRSSRENTSGWVQVEQWDQNKNGALDREEFHQGYLRDGFDLPWTGETKATTCSLLSEKLFTKLDSNGDGGLDANELTRRQVRYVVGKTFTEWKQWDDNGNNQLDMNEFGAHAVNDHLCGVFDPNSDGAISSDDLALANFSICDQDASGTVGTMEFYLWEIQQGRR
ncbi:MAG TPA: hypothetical protein VG737_04560 [Cyclobacteriaceae bacterium]|nr:hypothetical protein [Cyclobacteriaceae bacterium]